MLLQFYEKILVWILWVQEFSKHAQWLETMPVAMAMPMPMP